MDYEGHAINTNGFDKTYYLRGYFDNGDKLGSINNEECKIDLISQSFAIISDIVPDKQRDKVLAEVEKYLVDKDLKIVKLLTPAFNKSIDDPGYIMKYPEGIRENGGQYTHAVSWYIMALIKAGRNNTAYDIFQMINPIERSKKELSKMEELLGAPEIIDDICTDIVHHYEDNRANELSGKAMIVAYSRSVAIKMYEKILELRPDWDEKVKVVMSGSNKDPEEWYNIIGDKSYKKELENKFKDDEDSL